MPVLFFHEFNIAHIFLTTWQDDHINPFALRSYMGIIQKNSFRIALNL